MLDPPHARLAGQVISASRMRGGLGAASHADAGASLETWDVVLYLADSAGPAPVYSYNAPAGFLAGDARNMADEAPLVEQIQIDRCPTSGRGARPAGLSGTYGPVSSAGGFA